MTVSYVYRIYDGAGGLIYVGSTGDLRRRLDEHRQRSWWSPQAAKVRASLAPSTPVARVQERAAIAAEHPRWNVSGLSPRWMWTEAQYADYLTARSHTLPTRQSARKVAEVKADYSARFYNVSAASLLGEDVAA